MILTGKKIIEEVKSNKITISPFIKKELLQILMIYHRGNIISYTSKIIDPKSESSYEIIKIPGGFSS
jgi:hypothetical protein